MSREQQDSQAVEWVDPQDETPLPDVNYAMQWVFYYLLLAISIYVYCQGSQNRHFGELANRYLPMLLIAVCCGVVSARLYYNKLLIWTPITWFLMISALTFGLGPLLYFYGDDYSIRVVERLWVMDDYGLLRTNFINAIGMLAVCIGHGVMCYLRWRPTGKRFMPRDTVEFGKKMFWRVLWIALPIKWLVFIPMYLEMFNFIVPAFLHSIAHLVNICITLAFYIWFSGNRKYAWIALILLFSDAAVSLLVFSKTFLIIPFIQATVGIFMARPRMKILVLGAISVAAAYLWVKPLIEVGRNEYFHKERDLGSRIRLVEDYVSGQADLHSYNASADSEHWWTRQSFASIEGFVVNEYDAGHPGHSIREFWVMFIPRVLWPNKPDIAYEGRKLNYMIFGNDMTSIGATLYGEAYWNGGFPMVFGVSIFAGVMFALLGRLSLHYMSVMDLRYLPIAVMGIYYGLGVQEWFVLAFVGSIPMFFVIWYLTKFLVPIERYET